MMFCENRSDKLSEIHSDIRGPLYTRAMQMQARGTQVLKLNSGNPATYGFTMPQSVREALLQSVDNAVGYCDLRGMPQARQAILDYHRKKGIAGIGMDDIYLGNGVSELACICLEALLSFGDEVLVPSPGYSLWSNGARLAGAKPVFYRCDEHSDWYPDAGDIRRKITPKTRAIVIINPNNPTGALYPRQVLESLIQIAREHHLVIFSDEIYDRLVLDGKPHISTASLAEDVPIVTLNGLSKSHCICGFRCGWMVLSGPRDDSRGFREGIFELAAMRLCSNALTQLVVPAALGDSQSTNAMLVPGGRLYEQRRATVQELRKIPGIHFVENSAAFYLFPWMDPTQFSIPQDNTFARELLEEKHILLVPGNGFDWHTPGFFRLVMLPQAQQLRQAVQALGDLLDRYRIAPTPVPVSQLPRAAGE